MEKYSQYRDKGTGIAPFFPIPAQGAGIYLPFHLFLFIFRVPIILTVLSTYFLVFSWLPIGSLGKKALIWMILGVPGIWWIDIQIDGVRRGSLGKQPTSRLPQPSSIIVSSWTSPIDALYLAAIFDPIFTASYPNTRCLQHISLSSALLRSLLPPVLQPPPASSQSLTTLAALMQDNPTRAIVVLPECTTTNGRAILPLSPSLLTAPADARIYPTSLRYNPADITTPIPGWRSALRFFWNLCSQPTHTIRVRIAEPLYNTAASTPGSRHLPERQRETVQRFAASPKPNSYATNFLDTLNAASDAGSGGLASDSDTLSGNEDVMDGATGEVKLTAEEKRVLDKVGDALARLGRVKRVNLGVGEKSEFLRAWMWKRR